MSMIGMRRCGRRRRQERRPKAKTREVGFTEFLSAGCSRHGQINRHKERLIVLCSRHCCNFWLCCPCSAVRLSTMLWKYHDFVVLSPVAIFETTAATFKPVSHSLQISTTFLYVLRPQTSSQQPTLSVDPPPSWFGSLMALPLFIIV